MFYIIFYSGGYKVNNWNYTTLEVINAFKNLLQTQLSTENVDRLFDKSTMLDFSTLNKVDLGLSLVFNSLLNVGISYNINNKLIYHAAKMYCQF
ncbi:hypothetical protein TYM08_P1002 [Marinicellulosiphila megalodicopiae]